MKFADTSWWVAWALPDDSRHKAALRVLNSLGPRNEQVLTTNLVVGETWTFLRKKGGHRAALALIDHVEAFTSESRLWVHRVTEKQELAAWAWLRTQDERSYSFVDATSFRVMRDRRVREALAFDHAFAAAGFIEVQAGRELSAPRPRSP